MSSVNIVLLLILFILPSTNAKEFSPSVVCAAELEQMSSRQLQPVDYKLMYGNKTTENLANLLLSTWLVRAGIDRIGVEELRLALDPKYQEYLTDDKLLDNTQSYFQRQTSVNSVDDKILEEINALRSSLKLLVFNPDLIFSTYGLFSKEEIEGIVRYMESKYSEIRTCFQKQFNAVKEREWDSVISKHKQIYDVFHRTSRKLTTDLLSKNKEDNDE